MCNMCSVAAAAEATAKSTLCKFNCKHKAETGYVDFLAELREGDREREGGRERASECAFLSLLSLTCLQLMCVRLHMHVCV